MKISKERSGCCAVIASRYLSKELQRYMGYVADNVDNVYVPSDVSWDGDRYTFYVSHRQSLVEYIDEYGFDINGYSKVVRNIHGLLCSTTACNIPIYDYIFDYECIFVGSNIENMEFVYAPDREFCEENRWIGNKVSDLLAILSLHVSDADETIVKKLTHVSELIAEWENTYINGENGRDAFPYDEITKELTDGSASTDVSLSSSWKPLILFELSAGGILTAYVCLFGYEYVNIFVILLFLIIMFAGAYLLLPGGRKPDMQEFKERCITAKNSIVNCIGVIKKRIEKSEISKEEKIEDNMLKSISLENRSENIKKKGESSNMHIDGDVLVKGMSFYAGDDQNESVNIGRDNTWADVFLRYPFISRKHAKLYKERDGWYIMDMDSRNGTFVNSKRIKAETPYVLTDGSSLVLGRREVEFKIHLP